MRKSLIFTLMFLTLVTLLLSLPRNLVVVEIGTGTWCPYCPGAAMGADDLVHNGHPVAIIENHNGDAYANTYSNARNSYYGITGYPTAFFDGLNPSVGGSNTQSLYTAYLQKVNQRISVPSAYTISATGSMNANIVSLLVDIEKPEADANTNVVRHIVITESEIQQNWQGQTHLNFVTRLMVPNQNGTAVNLATGGSHSEELTFTWNPAWNIANSEIVIFLQNNTSKEILQGVKYSIPGLLGAYPVSHTDISFPDTYVTGTSTVPITITNFLSTPATGTISIDNPVFSTSSANFTIAGSQSVIIDIEFTPTADQVFNGVLTINSNLHENNFIEIPMQGNGFPNAAPMAEDVVVTGPPVLYQDIYVNYSFSDPDGDPEGSTEIQWMRIINNTPVPIEGAVNSLYRPVIEDLGWALAAQITPRDVHGMPGIPVLSTYTSEIEELPAPRNLSAAVTPPSTVVLTWERPLHYEGRAFVGYRVFRNGLAIYSTANPANLSFTDTYVPIGTHQYWVCSLFNNPMMVSDPSNVVTVNVGVSNDDNVLPVQSGMSVYPNPFTSSTVFNISSKANKNIDVSIYNLKGQLVNTFTAVTDVSGKAELSWDGTDSNGNKIISGVYLYHAKIDNKSFNGKIIYQK